ncbi:LysR family transcriptional regulator [Aliiroseovarius sp. Z3]|uniref:LysR family transcriptional regulator n=1 Tax=Aliiroseovarius sp. Z3 TaxID=2811402 RepID=UPI0023B2B714|nr:LysR family transcriptional regulator [Aliiroseovarius sp. Z3]MDE9450849.1 LysR family transcriptional regulator [Aliiroseovarius sp. Z3]
MNHWDEIRTAYHVARAGTVSGAAEALGIHHATVIRHVDALEARLGVKLFQRHARGYTPTEAGADLARIADTTEEQFAQLGARLKGQGEEVTGEVVVTALASFSRRLAPVLAAFQHEHPNTRIRLRTGLRLFRLEYGEAHVAIRAGSAPTEPDNVVQPFMTMDLSLCVAPSYVERYGMPTKNTLDQHRFIGGDDTNSRAPFVRWMNENVPAENITFRISDDASMQEALLAGAGVGFSTKGLHPELIEVMPMQPEWWSQFWLVTHVDLHRTAKVQAVLAHLKRAAKEWAADEPGIKLP